MTTAGPIRRVGAVLLMLPILLLMLLVSSAGSAAAHAVLESSSPEQGSQVATAPREVVLTFSEEVGVSARALQVLDPRGRRVDHSDAAHPDGDRRSLRVAFADQLETGSYTVLWRVVSADGHPASGTFTFGVGVAAGAAPPAISVDPAVAAVRAVGQLIAYAGTALLVGGSAFVFLIWRGGHASTRVRRLLITGCAVAGAGALTTLLVQGPYVAGVGLAGLLDPGLLAETASSGYGRPLLLRVLAVALAVPVLGIWPRLSDGVEQGGPGGVAAAGTMVLLVASFALTGHAAEASPRLLAEVAAGIHHGAAGIWLGGLVVLLLAFLPEARQAERSTVLPMWSRVALGCVAVLLVTGLYQAWREVRTPEALPGTAYGRLMLGKLALVGLLIALAAFARRALGAAMATSGRSPSPVGRLQSLVTVEAVLGLAVLGVTSFLVATPPARVTFGPPHAASLTAQDFEGRTLRVAVDVSPTRVGPQTVSLRISGPEGAPVTFQSAYGQLRSQADDTQVDLTFSGGADGRVSAPAVVPSPGDWTLTVHVLTDATSDYAASTTYTVR